MKSKTLIVYNWYAIQDEICKKMGISKDNFRDLKNSSNHFDKWCESRKYGEKDLDGKDRCSSQVWFGEYNKASDGNAARPAYIDLWHFALKTVIPGNMHNDSIVTMYAVEDYDECPEYYHEGFDWKELFFKAYNEIMLNIDPKFEGVSVEFSW